MATSVSESSNASSNASSSSTIEEDEESSSSSLSAHALAEAYNESLVTGQPLLDDVPHVIKRSPVTVTRPKRLELGGKNTIKAETDGVFVLEKPKARINKLLPVDEFAHIFSFLDGMSIGPVSEVCHDWHLHTQDPLIWRIACQQYWWCEDDIKLEKKCKKYGDSWKRMLIERHHVRYDGFYVLDTTYWQPGGFGFGERQSRVQKVSYFRYLHFRPNGKVYYCLTNYEPDAERGISTDDKQLSIGTYKFNHESIAIKVDVGHMMAWMMLKFMHVNYLIGVHNRLEFVEFYGQGAKDRAPICFNITSTLFRFYRFRS